MTVVDAGYVVEVGVLEKGGAVACGVLDAGDAWVGMHEEK